MTTHVTVGETEPSGEGGARNSIVHGTKAQWIQPADGNLSNKPFTPLALLVQQESRTTSCHVTSDQMVDGGWDLTFQSPSTLRTAGTNLMPSLDQLELVSGLRKQILDCSEMSLVTRDAK